MDLGRTATGGGARDAGWIQAANDTILFPDPFLLDPFLVELAQAADDKTLLTPFSLSSFE